MARVVVILKSGKVMDPVSGVHNVAHVLGRMAQGAHLGYSFGVAEVKNVTTASSGLTKEEKRAVVMAAIEATLKLL
jgi:hypothetical protein